MKRNSKFMLGLMLWTIGQDLADHHALAVIISGGISGVAGAFLMLIALDNIGPPE